VATWSGTVYVAFVIDAFSRRILGWKAATTMRTELVLDALEMAIFTREQEGITDLAGLVHHNDAGSQGGINWSSQHLECEGLRWEYRSGVVRIGRVGLRCGLLAARLGCGVSIAGGSGRRSRAACRARTPRRWPACRRRSGRGGSVRVAGCQRSAWLRCRGGTCRSPSGRRSRSCTHSTSGYARSPAVSAGRRRRFRGSCAETHRLARIAWTIGRRPRSGTRNGVPAARRSPSSRPTIGCASTAGPLGRYDRPT
jgi:hypothetical protein